ncbi:FecR family protein [Leptospira sp. GIMC2001]|uniref:FecR family protein n=1 Tax=Leptospira sp. GIMC2001 TaxID=1513297 RepID=UPI0023498FF5|nr:FecR family protein [Leptospira sp. GIMC2001]WCL48064.1 FecR family protein [Leptospira sp. GIMC2001]
MRFLNKTAVTVPILLVVAGIFSFLLYLSFTQKIEAGDNPTIGILTFKTRTIQRKYDNEVIWESITTSTEIRNKDTIRTEKSSDAVLTLEDGTEIQIGENSMIFVDFSDKNYNLNFAYGTVSADRKGAAGDSAISIQTGDSTIKVGSGELSMDKTGDSLNIKVGSGTSKILSGDQEQTVSEDQTAKISDSGLSVKNQNYKLLTPSDRSISSIPGKSQRVKFSWSSDESKKNLPVSIEIASDIGFRRIIKKADLKQSSFETDLVPGSYYWRLKYKEKGIDESTATSRFTLLKTENIRIFTPTSGQVISYLQGSSIPPVSFSWSKIDLANSYKVEIAKDRSFASALATKETRNNSIAFNDLEVGTYFFRITGKSSLQDQKDIVSEIGSFSIGIKTEVEAPQLLDPQNGKSIEKIAVPETGLFFAWKDNKDYASFTLTVGNDPNISNPILTETVKTNYFKWKNDIAPGKYYWKIVGTAKSGSDNKASNIYSFNITEGVQLSLVRPSDRAREDFPENGTMTFSWKALPKSGKTLLEISNKPSFENPVISKEVSGLSQVVNLPKPGTYYWRLNWEGNSQKTLSSIFSFTTVTKVLPPKLNFPARNQTVDMTTRDSLVFQWSNVTDSDGYMVQLFDTTGLREREVFSIKTRETRYEMRDLTKLNQGKFRWEVKTFLKNPDGTSTESLSEKAEFFITLTTGIQTKILSPEKVYVE